MLINISNLSDVSLQEQIVKQIRAKILTGKLKSDQLLPSVRSLASDLKVSVITVRRAYEVLLNEKMIYSRRGKGYFVSSLQLRQKKNVAKNRLTESLKPVLKAAKSDGLAHDEILETILSHMKVEKTK